jgi:hypothetical protein
MAYYGICKMTHPFNVDNIIINRVRRLYNDYQQCYQRNPTKLYCSHDAYRQLLTYYAPHTYYITYDNKQVNCVRSEQDKPMTFMGCHFVFCDALIGYIFT